jgi:hypothetical protein
MVKVQYKKNKSEANAFTCSCTVNIPVLHRYYL